MKEIKEYYIMLKYETYRNNVKLMYVSFILNNTKMAST